MYIHAGEGIHELMSLLILVLEYYDCTTSWHSLLILEEICQGFNLPKLMRLYEGNSYSVQVSTRFQCDANHSSS